MGTSAALSPDGQQIAIADRQTVAVVGLAERKVVQRDPGSRARARLLAGRRDALEAQLGTAAASVASEISRTTSTMSRFAFQTRS